MASPEADREGESSAAWTIGRRLAGPALVVTSVVLVLNAFVFRGLMPMADPLRFWLPTYCHLGRSVAAGHIPAWDPYLIGGAPFAADPQSGWMYLPVMVLFGALPCDVAIRALIVIQPILAGLGIYAFARSEGLSRIAATAGGLVLALTISSADLTTSIPFAGSLAWTALLLAAVSKAAHAGTWLARLVWGTLAALAWGQLAAAHFSVGLVFGTGALLAYLALVGWRAWAATRWGGVGKVALLSGLLVIVALALNLAYLMPRLSYLPRTNLSLGYAKLTPLAAELAGAPPPRHVIGPAAGMSWPLKLTTFPGMYAGALALLLSFAGWWDRSRRPMVVAFSAYGVIAYGLSLAAVARLVPPAIQSWRLVDMYLHSPEWFGYILLPILAILAAVGLESWLGAESSRRRLAMLVPGAVVWLVLPLLFGASLGDVYVVMLSAVAGCAALALVARRPSLAVVLPAMLAVELTITGAAGNRVRPLPFAPVPVLVQALANPNVDAAEVVRTGPIVDGIRADGLARYMKLPRQPTDEPVPPPDVNGMVTNHSLLFDIEDTGTFNPTQPLRFWIFLRAVQDQVIKYNRAYFSEASPVAMDLLQVGWLVAPDGRPPEPGTTVVASDGERPPWVLYRRDVVPARAEAIPAWRVLPDSSSEAYPNSALDAILAPGFDPSGEVILERDPGLGPPTVVGPAGRAPVVTFTPQGDQAARVTVEADTPVVLLVRTVFDPNWHADVDGHPAPILRADYFLQAVALTPGRHTVSLAYHDPTIGYGLWGSAVAWGAVLVTAGALAVRRRRPANG